MDMSHSGLTGHENRLWSSGWSGIGVISESWSRLGFSLCLCLFWNRSKENRRPMERCVLPPQPSATAIQVSRL